MAEATRGRRLSSSVLSRTVALPLHTPATARIVFSAPWLVVGIVAGLVGRHWWSWLIASALILPGLLALRSNGESLLWTWDERHDQDRKALSVGRQEPILGGEVPKARLRDVGPGDSICDYDEHQHKLTEAERKYQRELSDQQAKERQRTYVRPVTIKTTIRPPRRYTTLDSGLPQLDLTMPADLLRPETFEFLPTPSFLLPVHRAEPTMDWMQVLSIVPSADGREAELGLLHRDTLTAPLERWYYRRKAMNAVGLDAEDPALAELMSLLRARGGGDRESKIVAALRASGHSVASIQRAVAAAVAVGLARRSHRTGRRSEVVTAAFGFDEPASVGHRSCYLQLTATGRAWLSAGDPKPQPRRPKWHLRDTCRHCGAPVLKGVKIFEDDPRCSKCGEFPGGEYISSEANKD